jgi:hypothetical protein
MLLMYFRLLFVLAMISLSGCLFESAKSREGRRALEQLAKYAQPQQQADSCHLVPGVVRLEWLPADECPKAGDHNKNSCYRYLKVIPIEEECFIRTNFEGFADITSEVSGQTGE